MPGDEEFIYVNGIDPETGQYAVPPVSVSELAAKVRVKPGAAAVSHMRGPALESFGVPYGVDLNKLGEAGWGIVFYEDTPQEVRNALAPLIELRHGQAGNLFKELDYKKGEQARDWYRRHGATVGTPDPEIVPYYLLLVGPPAQIPFEFQYLIGVDYAVGRLDFATAAEYGQYAASIQAYESAASLPNKKEITFWGTCHPGDGATNLSASSLVTPLANGIAEAAGALKKPVNIGSGYERALYLGDDATKDRLLATLHGATPPALLFTASHGLAIRAGRANQHSDQGALLCQDWPGFGSVQPGQVLSAADIPDDANVNGLVAMLFACFGGGTPDIDQFLMDLSDAGSSPKLAPEPFVAALPRRLLAHPKGSALAVIGHIDRAWAYSIRPPRMTGAQITYFHNSLRAMLNGDRVGSAISQQFGGHFAALSALLLNAVSPATPETMKPSDRDLVNFWIERNDAQNYVILGDPAVRIRKELLS